MEYQRELSKNVLRPLGVPARKILEEGRWPEVMKNARAAFLAKELDKGLDPLAYRVLLMLPAVYLLWGRTRLNHLGPWVAGWDLEEIYAGTKGKGGTRCHQQHCSLYGEMPA